MSYQTEYAKKLVSAEAAAAVVQSGDWVEYGWATTVPHAVDAALAKRLPSLENVNFRGGVVLSTPEIFKIDHPEEHMTWNSWHMTGVERKTIAAGFGYYIPLRYSELPRHFYDIEDKPDVVIQQVGPMDKFGYFNLGPSASHAMASIENGKKVIVEVNKNMPNCLGGFKSVVHISDVDYIVEGENPPIVEMPGAPITDVDRKVAEYIVNEIPNGACLQLGIGGMPNAVGSAICDSDLKDLGVHTEMYVDGFVDLANAGKINGKCKSIDPGRQVYAFAAGTKKLYDYLDNNPECMSAPVSYTNDIRSIASIDRFMSINNAVDFDLFGQVNAETAGLRHISGAGGQLDFVLGAYLSNGGKSFICLSSTFKNKQGELKSRILPTLNTGSVVTDTRANVQYLVTEYGCVNLKGLPTWQRAEKIISIAHPMFRDDLIKEAEKMQIWRRSNKR